jgi:hypothetical protein
MHAAIWHPANSTINNQTEGNQMKRNMTTSKTDLLRKYVLLLAAITAVFGPHGAWASDSVPFSGSAEGAIVSAAPDPAGLLVTVSAEGEATYLGRFSREEVLLLDAGTGTIAGTIVFTAANGDELSGVVAGQFTSLTTVAGTYTFTGGTGRFENASGEADFSLATADGIHFEVEFAGNLSSVGANKK